MTALELFQANFKRLRIKLGYSQATLGEVVGIHTNTVAKLERGDCAPSWPMINAICEGLDVKPATLFRSIR